MRGLFNPGQQTGSGVGVSGFAWSAAVLFWGILARAAGLSVLISHLVHSGWGCKPTLSQLLWGCKHDLILTLHPWQQQRLQKVTGFSVLTSLHLFFCACQTSPGSSCF